MAGSSNVFEVEYPSKDFLCAKDAASQKIVSQVENGLKCPSGRYFKL
jgi:hypothetical protein